MMTENAESEKSLSGKVILITGASSGIGYEAARFFAKKGAKLYLACRAKDKTLPIIDNLKEESKNDDIHFLSLDLGDLESVRNCANEFLSLNIPLHILVNNAGLASGGSKTKQGFELIFGTNHLGHFLLTKLLLEKLKESAPSRVINVASKANNYASEPNWDDLKNGIRKSDFSSYSFSKSCNIAFTIELARKLEGTGVNTFSLHPGVVGTDVWRGLPKLIVWFVKKVTMSPEDGAKPITYTALSSDLNNKTALYFDYLTETKPGKLASTEDFQKELWTKSEEWTAVS